MIRQELLEVDYVFIKKHTSDLTSELLAEGSLDLRIDSVTDKLLLKIRVWNGVKLGSINLRKW